MTWLGIDGEGMTVPFVPFETLFFLGFYRWRCADHAFANDNGLAWNRHEVGP